MSVTKAQCREYVRFRADQHGISYIKTSDATQFDLDEALSESLRKWAIKTRCFPVEYERAAVASQAIYSFEYFGYQAADTDALSVLAAADNVNPFTIATQSTQITPVSITLKNNTGGLSSGNAVIFTVVGTRTGLEPLTDTVVFTAADLLNKADQATVAKQTIYQFTSVTSITPDSSGAQPAGWQHSAGVPTLTPGSRIIDLCYVAYNEVELYRKNRHDMDMISSRWRFADSGTPEYWMPWGEKQIRVYRPSSGTDPIYIEGWEIPDPTMFAADAHIVDLPDEDAYAMSLWAAILATTKNPNDEGQLRANIFYPEWEAAARASFRRIHNSADTPIFGKHGGRKRSGEFTFSDTIVTIP